MVIRKPYALLIKHFKKIHIALLIFSLYIYYKVLSVNGFVSEFVALQSYNANVDPIAKYVTFLLLIITIISFVINLLLILLLRHKDKPWKLYLLPTIEYGILFFVLVWARSFFNFYDGSQTGMDIRLIRDVIFISTIAQFPIVLIYSMRILGLDLQKFNFKLDEEYLEMDEDDRKELEININIDYHVFIRLFNKTKRYLKYFYLEHKKICNTIAIIIIVLLLRKAYIFVFITNKSYKQGDIYNANAYTIVINNSYYTNKDKAGEIIEKGKAFIIVDVSIKNNWDKRYLKLNNFHIMKGVDNYSEVSKTHSTDFDDLGKTIDSTKRIKRDETVNTLLIFKVNADKRVRTNKYVLYYQEINDYNSTHLRKIKLNIKDLSNLSVDKNLKLGQKFPIKLKTLNDRVSFETAEIKDKIVYSKSEYLFNEYTVVDKEQETKLEKKILQIDFSSDEIDGKELIDFSTKYGKIKYDDNNKSKVIKIENAVDRNYYGKSMYIYIPNTIEKTNDIDIIYTIRDKKYTYNLAGGD